MRSFVFPQLSKEPISVNSIKLPRLKNVRVHSCKKCNYTTTRDVAASQEIRNRGISALGHSVVQNVCGLDATGSIGNNILVGTERNRKPKS